MAAKAVSAIREEGATLDEDEEEGRGESRTRLGGPEGRELLAKEEIRPCSSGASAEAASSSDVNIRTFGAYRRFWEKKSSTSPDKEDVSQTFKSDDSARSSRPVFRPKRISEEASRRSAGEGATPNKKVDFISAVRQERTTPM
eukprot:746522-Hanusia_phi.AAC.13